MITLGGFMKKLLWITVLLLLFSACEKASNTVVGMPNIAVDCREAGCNTTLNEDTVFVIVTKSGCANADFDPVASGSTNVSCTASGCTGSVSSWVDANGNSVSEIISGTHDICSYIDSISNTKQDAGEMVSVESKLITSDSSFTVETWTVGNFVQ